MVNFGPLAAEINPVVWSTPSYFNGYRVLATLLHGTLLVGVSQTLWRWTEGANYIRQGDHHVGRWPTFLVVFDFTKYINNRSVPALAILRGALTPRRGKSAASTNQNITMSMLTEESKTSIFVKPRFHMHLLHAVILGFGRGYRCQSVCVRSLQKCRLTKNYCY